MGEAMEVRLGEAELRKVWRGSKGLGLMQPPGPTSRICGMAGLQGGLLRVLSEDPQIKGSLGFERETPTTMNNIRNTISLAHVLVGASFAGRAVFQSTFANGNLNIKHL